MSEGNKTVEGILISRLERKVAELKRANQELRERMLENISDYSAKIYELEEARDKALREALQLKDELELAKMERETGKRIHHSKKKES